MSKPKVEQGVYIHYKGGLYSVLGTATHSETGEDLVVYVSKGKMWARPLAMFTEEVEARGKKMPRFRRLKVSNETGNWEKTLATAIG